jgi:hypothetical protein
MSQVMSKVGKEMDDKELQEQAARLAQAAESQK